MRLPRRLAVPMGALLVAALWGPAPALAVTSPFIVTADRPAAVPSGKFWAFNDFFPRTFSVHRNRVVVFKILGFHTATLLPRGMTVGQDRNRTRVEKLDADDTTRNPNGTRKATFELAALAPTSTSCGSVSTPCTFNGSSIVSGSGLGPPGPFYVNITAPVGTYQFLCRVHPGMTGSLTVVSAATHATSGIERSRKVAAQIRQDRREGFVAETAANRAGVHLNANGTRTWLLTAGTGTAHTAVLEMLPRNLNIRKGDTVAWRSPQVNEPHTVTFPEDLGTEVLPKCEEAGGVDSDGSGGCGGHPPNRPPDEFEFGGGNGVRLIVSPTTISDSGLMQSHAMDTALHLPFDAARALWSVRFTRNAALGTYRYMCQIHGDAMEGFIIVH